jgi:O-antigen biosynthesis protein
MIPGPRLHLVRLIERKFKNVHVGQAYFEEMAKIYSSSRVVFNRSVKNDVNMRVFEALASGSLLMTNDLAANGQAELFRDGVQLATYRDGHDLVDKLHFYLDREAVREKMAAAGRAEVLAKHTYEHRLEKILKRVQGSEFRVQGRNQKAGVTSQKTEVGDRLQGTVNSRKRQRETQD